MELNEKLEILSDAAKYDVSCSSSGSTRKNKNGLGNASVSGICHSWSQDGRCISLLKILLTNNCIYDCKYCINAKSSNTRRAIFTVDEVVDLTINFYKRNYIEGLFLSSAVFISPDKTMEMMIEIARKLRFQENFNGYIHMKAIPSASEELIKEMGMLVDRMSINIELPTRNSLQLLAPEKSYEGIYKPMKEIGEEIKINSIERRKHKSLKPYVPAGQTTQMIIGASGERDLDIVKKSEELYTSFNLKRVYYSAYVPVGVSKILASVKKAPLLREHRIYQADFLMRFYGFTADELLSEKNPNLDLKLDPKLFYAIENYNGPIEINRATYEELLRIPGFGPKSCRKIINARRYAALKYDDLKTLGISYKRSAPFITVGGKYEGFKFDTIEALRHSFDEPSQLSFLE